MPAPRCASASQGQSRWQSAAFNCNHLHRGAHRLLKEGMGASLDDAQGRAGPRGVQGSRRVRRTEHVVPALHDGARDGSEGLTRLWGSESVVVSTCMLAQGMAPRVSRACGEVRASW